MAIITLSTATFSGARRLAQSVSERLGYRLVSRDEIVEKIEQYGMSRHRIARARRRQLGLLNRLDLGWKHYLVFVRAALSKEIRQGNLVYLGDGGRASLRDFPSVLSVRVAADIEFRVEALMKRTDYVINAKRAKQLIARIDEKKARWQRTLYEDGVHDDSDFDLVVEPGPTSIADACELICAAIEEPRVRATSKSLEEIELLTIAAELRARIAMQPDVVDDEVDVEVGDGVITISGSVDSTEDFEAIQGLLY